MRFTFRPMTEPDARAIIAWRYAEPYAVYNMSEDALGELLDVRAPYIAVDAIGTLAGYFAFGSAAEVGAIGEPHTVTGDGALAVGLGLRPDLTGQRKGVGLAFVAAGLAFARRRFAPVTFRLFVLPFNTRAIRVYERAGFVRHGVVHVHTPHGPRDFIEMRRPA